MAKPILILRVDVQEMTAEHIQYLYKAATFPDYNTIIVIKEPNIEIEVLNGDKPIEKDLIAGTMKVEDWMLKELC